MMTRITLNMYAIALAAMLTAAPALAQNSTPGKVNGKPISKSQIDFFIAAQKAQGRPDSPELRNAVLEQVIRREVLIQEAQKQGIDKKTDIKTKMDLARHEVLIQAYLEDYVDAHPISEDSLKQEYESVKLQLGDKEYRARHILVESEEDAKAIIAKLKAGEQFDTLAAQSKDPGSKDKGGDLGWSVPSTYTKPFADALQKLNKNQYTEVPVQSDFGWHVIKLEDTRALKLPDFNEAKPQIKQRLQQQLVEKQITKLRSKATVE